MEARATLISEMFSVLRRDDDTSRQLKLQHHQHMLTFLEQADK